MPKVKSILLTLIVTVLIALICLFGYVMFQNLCVELFIRWGWETRQVFNLFPNGFWVTFFLLAVLPPIYEELIFRWLVCRGLALTKMKPLWIVIVSAVIFALYHASWSQLIYQFIMGIFFAWIFLKTKNLLWTMLIHFINNAFVITYTYMSHASASVFELSALNIGLALGLAVIATVAVTFLIRKGIPYAAKS